MNEKQLLKIKTALGGIPHHYVGVIPFSREITSETPLSGQDYIPYGSTLLTMLTKNLGWKGLHFNDNFDYEICLKHRKDMLNGEMILTVPDAIKKLAMAHAGEQADVFIRPTLDLKQFSGQVMGGRECHDWLIDALLCESSGSYKLDASTKVVIDHPKKIQAEWRWFIIDRKIVDGSMYRSHGQLIKKHETDAAVIKEAQTFADGWLPADCCVMDLALVDDEVKVIEFNCINSSGFYDHDIEKIFSKWYKYHTSGTDITMIDIGVENEN